MQLSKPNNGFISFGTSLKILWCLFCILLVRFCLFICLLVSACLLNRFNTGNWKENKLKMSLLTASIIFLLQSLETRTKKINYGPIKKSTTVAKVFYYYYLNKKYFKDKKYSECLRHGALEQSQ